MFPVWQLIPFRPLEQRASIHTKQGNQEISTLNTTIFIESLSGLPNIHSQNGIVRSPGILGRRRPNGERRWEK